MLSAYFDKPISVNQANALLWEWETEMRERDAFQTVCESLEGYCMTDSEMLLFAHMEREADRHNVNANKALMSLWRGGYNAYHDRGFMGAPTLANDMSGEIVCRLNPYDLEEL